MESFTVTELGSRMNQRLSAKLKDILSNKIKMSKVRWGGSIRVVVWFLIYHSLTSRSDFRDNELCLPV